MIQTSESRASTSRWLSPITRSFLCCGIGIDMGECKCRQCRRDRKEEGVPGWPIELTQMIVCQICGNKRCPHATDHRNACTGSNEPTDQNQSLLVSARRYGVSRITSESLIHDHSGGASLPQSAYQQVSLPHGCPLRRAFSCVSATHVPLFPWLMPA